MSTLTGGDLELVKPEWTDNYKVTIGTDLPATFQKIDDEFSAHKADNVRHITSAERTTWNGKQNALGYTPVNKSGDEMTGILTAHSNTSYTVRQVRNIILSTANANVSAMQNGDIWIKYK